MSNASIMLFFSYGKTKEAFGWPDESEETSNVIASGSNTNQSSANAETESSSSANSPPTTLER